MQDKGLTTTTLKSTSKEVVYGIASCIVEVSGKHVIPIDSH